MDQTAFVPMAGKNARQKVEAIQQEILLRSGGSVSHPYLTRCVVPQRSRLDRVRRVRRFLQLQEWHLHQEFQHSVWRCPSSLIFFLRSADLSFSRPCRHPYRLGYPSELSPFSSRTPPTRIRLWIDLRPKPLFSFLAPERYGLLALPKLLGSQLGRERVL